jgi:predicted RNA polymerase sigma factor
MERLGEDGEARLAYEKAIELASDDEGARRHYQGHLDALRAEQPPPASPGG